MSESAYVAGYMACLRDLDGSQTIERIGIVLADPELAALMSLHSPGWLAKQVARRDRLDKAARKATREDSGKQGTVYVLLDRMGCKVKIGFTAGQVEGRQRQIESSAGVDLELMGSWRGTTGLERSLHERFAEHRVRGEWFTYEGDISDWVCAVRAACAPPQRPLSARDVLIGSL